MNHKASFKGQIQTKTKELRSVLSVQNTSCSQAPDGAWGPGDRGSRQVIYLSEGRNEVITEVCAFSCEISASFPHRTTETFGDIISDAVSSDSEILGFYSNTARCGPWLTLCYRSLMIRPRCAQSVAFQQCIFLKT